MMNAKIIKNILSSSCADEWEISDVCEEGWEFYFIRHELDQHRARKVEHIKVTVYKRTDGFLGNAGGEIAPTSTEEEAKDFIERLILRAGCIKNPDYTLNPPKKAEPLGTACTDITKNAEDFLEVMKSVKEDENSYINSYEIFTGKKKVHFINSEGIDVTEEYPSSMLEVVVNAKKDGHEIELYRMYESGSCAKDTLKREIEKTMRYGLDRLEAVPTPALEKCAVVFSTSDAAAIYSYFEDNMSAGFAVRKMSDISIGDEVVKDARGDKVTVKARRFIKDSSCSFAYDEEGAPTRDVTIIENNIARERWGSRIFSQYLGLEESGIVYNWEVSGGTAKESDIRSGRFLEIVEFSDFQCDSATGDIFGEIRLAFLHDGDGSVKIVTGGSVSGTMAELAKNMRMSEAQAVYNNVIIPELTRLEGVTVTGAQQ